jgi:hypothetical protein
MQNKIKIKRTLSRPRPWAKRADHSKQTPYFQVIFENLFSKKEKKNRK